METSSLNHLANERSPYLRQHASNPVDWYPWGKEAFDMAKESGKPIFLSIGYSTCYWCHVMEKDSFEKEDVAALLNRWFIPIKVDREERPDVDQLYMAALQSFAGRGGWPMSMFLTPDLKPFWGGTFFRHSEFLKILEAVSTTWLEKKNDLASAAEEITEALARDLDFENSERETGESVVQKFVTVYNHMFDTDRGGFSVAPKFPEGLALNALLIASEIGEDEKIRNKAGHMVLLTLNRMAEGGIYDQIGGGFHRYSVDESWRVPHFEKMLYDNAILASVYLGAFQASGCRLFKDVAIETLDYLNREMKSPEGGFFGAQDAGEAGKEGEYYVWSWEELEKLLSNEELKALQKVLGVKKEGNFERGHSNFYVTSPLGHEELRESYFQPIRQKLLGAREGRRKPHRDEKIICAWNGLAIEAFARGYRVTGNPVYLESAQQIADFLWRKLFKPEGLYRTFCDGELKGEGCADDFACFVKGLIELYQADFDTRWLKAAKEVAEKQIESLWDETEGAFLYSAAQELPVKSKDWMDSPTPSGNGLTFFNLSLLGVVFDDFALTEKASRLKEWLNLRFERFPQAMAGFANSAFKLKCGLNTAVIAGGGDGSSREMIRRFNSKLNPGWFLALASPLSDIPLLMKTPESSEPAVFICRDSVCEKPLTNPDAMNSLSVFKRVTWEH